MMKKTPALAALAAALALAACDSKSDAENAAAMNAANTAAETAVVADMPPPIKSSKAYRCGDNSLVYADLFDGDTQAAIRESKDGTSTKLVAPEPGKPMVAKGYSLEVSGKDIKVELPGRGKLTCKG